MTISCRVSPCSRKDIRKYSRHFREQLNLGNALEFPIVEVLEGFSEAGYFDIEIVPVDAMPNSYGETLYHQKLIRIREDIYDKACEGDGFSRSTIAHELFHFFKHRNEEIVFCRTVEELESRKTYEDPEWQANCFAGELLVPIKLVKEMSIEEVVEKCRVSHQMATYQLNKYEIDGWV
ncbi:ImmA/IrrE family metallo-endopeptidase [Streptococcus minor]|uniref:ImmA/IrrE family metallo-endopeptidase n=1 Tax=Streptococcus minor TaxID=229549 RepID=UPI00035E058E|nr:ImmA/IrrE family metallo-endopeptidase [Streptococcus minor]